MTVKGWISSHELMKLLSFAGCELQEHSDPEMIKVFSAKTDAMVVIPISGSMPRPAGVEIIERLRLVDELLRQGNKK